jgi:hypothetical protein
MQSMHVCWNLLFFLPSCWLTHSPSLLLGSKFGAVLDMVTDRSSSVLLLAYLMHHGHSMDVSFPPHCILDFVNSRQDIFQVPSFGFTLGHGTRSLMLGVLIALDISSHYMHMVSSLMLGATSHKKISSVAHGAKDCASVRLGEWLLKWYYESQLVLFCVCALNEAFFLALFMSGVPKEKVAGAVNSVAGYLRQSTPNGVLDDIYTCYLPVLFSIAAPVACLKQAVNIIQLSRAARNLVQADTSPTTSLKMSRKFD